MSNLRNEMSKITQCTEQTVTRKELVSALINTHNRLQSLILHVNSADAKCQCGAVLYCNKRLFDRLDNSAK